MLGLVDDGCSWFAVSLGVVRIAFDSVCWGSAFSDLVCSDCCAVLGDLVLYGWLL